MYDIGQIIYIYKATSDSLFPCIVCEEVVKKTLQGKETSYRILLPDAEGTIVDLSKVEAVCFKTIEEFKEHYMNIANTKLKLSIDNCNKIKEQRFSEFLKKIPKETNQDSESKKESSIKSNKKESITIEEQDVKFKIDMSKLEELGL